MKILIVDAQGGGIGKQLVTAVKKALPEAEILAAGTNSAAAAVMKKAGADHAATGENAVVVCARQADVIIGPLGMVIADAMYGEITPAMAAAIAQAPAARILIPFNNCDNVVVGVEDLSTGQLIAEAVDRLLALAGR